MVSSLGGNEGRGSGMLVVGVEWGEGCVEVKMARKVTVDGGGVKVRRKW